MKWWQIRKRDTDLERELGADLELGEDEQRENGVPPAPRCMSRSDADPEN